eukprot:3703743-Pyramimonas_sp.AAC.1
MCALDELTAKQEYQSHLKALTGLIQAVTAQPWPVACETLKCWRAKTTFQRDGAPQLVRHTFFVSSWIQGAGGLMTPMNAVIVALFRALGSQPKMGPPLRTTQERRVQNSLEKMLRGARHKKW